MLVTAMLVWDVSTQAVAMRAQQRDLHIPIRRTMTPGDIVATLSLPAAGATPISEATQPVPQDSVFLDIVVNFVVNREHHWVTQRVIRIFPSPNTKEWR